MFPKQRRGWQFFGLKLGTLSLEGRERKVKKKDIKFVILRSSCLVINEREGRLFVVLPCFFACTVGERKVGNAKGLDGSLSFCFLYVSFMGVS